MITPRSLFSAGHSKDQTFKDSVIAPNNPQHLYLHHHYQHQNLSQSLNPSISKLNYLKNRRTIASTSLLTGISMIDETEDLLLSYGADQSPSPPHHPPPPLSPPLPPPPPPPGCSSTNNALSLSRGINLSLSSTSGAVTALNTITTASMITGKRTNKRKMALVKSETDCETLLACLVCGKNFVSFGRLKSHEKTHSKSRPFKCIDCGKTFTVRYSLICHTRVHTRERPYGCSFCGSRFSQASSLKTHQIYKHTKEFPYLCKYCGRGFISPGQKHEHIQRTHLKSFSSLSSLSSNTSPSSSSLSSSSSSSSSSSHVDSHLKFKCRPTEPPVIRLTSSVPKMTTTSVQTDIRLPPGLIY